MSLQLCDMLSVLRGQHIEKSTAHLIQDSCSAICDDPLKFDEAAIAVALADIYLRAIDVLRAVEWGCPCNQKGQALDASTVESELRTLSESLQKTIDKVNKTLTSEKGKKQWKANPQAIECLTHLVGKKMQLMKGHLPTEFKPPRHVKKRKRSVFESTSDK